MRCSTALLQSALAGNLPADEETALHEHLEACDECSAALEGMAGGPAWCRETAALLGQDEFDDALPPREEWSEVDFTVEHLEPADEPGVLGRLGGYDVLEIIGHGGMGVVLKAYDRELKRTVAIKVLAPHLARNSLARKRFAREAQAAAAVVHPHVLAIHQVQAAGRLPFLVMPLVAGESLAERLTAQGTLELKETLRIGMQAAAGLAAAHEQGLVHRDVKPANILLEKGVERAVLTDFGLARAADDVTLTRWGVVAGTPQYMSPEQARGEPLDGRSDLFSLGCVLYEMATGVSPFRTESPLATMRRLIDDTPQPIDAINPELPPWFGAIVHRLLEKDPSRRFQSAAEVSELLEECLAHVQRPAAVPLPIELSLPTYQPHRVSGRFPRKPRASVRRLIAGALIASAALFAGAVIVLELNKGTLTIESQADDVALRITEGDQVVEKLTVTRGNIDVRIAAGKYRVEIDGAADGIAIENGTVTIQRRGSKIVRVVRSAEGHGALKAGLNALANPQSKAHVAQEAERIATKVAGQIEKLKSKYPQLEKFSAAENLKKNRNQETLRQENPLLFEIRYQNGALNEVGGTPFSTYDEHNGLFLLVNFFERNQTGLPGYSLGKLHIELHIHGPKGEAVRLEVDRFLRSFGATHIGNDGQELEPPAPTSASSAGSGILDSSITAAFLQRSEKTAREVAEQIDELKGQYPQIKNFSITEHLKKDGKFYVIQYENGVSVQAKKPTDRSYDEETGILLELGFYPPDARIWLTDPKISLADPKNESSVFDLEDFLVALLVSGPAQEPIRDEMARILKSMGAEEVPRATPTIAHLVARRIEELKGRYPQFEKFSAFRHFHANTAREGSAPGTPNNPELYSISYLNGVLASGAVPKEGPRRSPEVSFDPQTGIQLDIHFFNGDSRGADPTPPYRIDNLSVHVYVKGPAAEQIRGEIVRILKDLGAEQPALDSGDTPPSSSLRPALPPQPFQADGPTGDPSGPSAPTRPEPFPANTTHSAEAIDLAPGQEVHHLVWGETKNGLQAGIAFLGTDERVYEIGEQVPIAVRLRNVSSEVQTIKYTSARLRFAQPQIEGPKGERVQVIMPPRVRYVFPTIETSLKPGQEITFAVVQLQLATERPTRVSTPHIVASPGEYRITYTVPLLARDRRDWPVTGTLRFEVADENKARSAALRFSEPRELVLTMNSSKYMLDLDSGETMGAPARADRAELGRMDVHATQMQPNQYPTGLSGAPSSFLPGQPMRGMKVKSSQWNASAAEVRRALAGDDVPPLTQMDYKPLEPATYFFKTEAGADGILELMSLTEDPKGIRIRYKTVISSANQPVPSPGKTTGSPPGYPKQSSPSPYQLAAESIAEKLAAHLESLKDKFPHLGKFSAAEHLRKNTDRDGDVPAPGTLGNPELYSISYHNGVTRRASPPTAGPKRATEYDYDPKAGIRLNIHVFKGRSRGNDLSVPYQIGDLSVHVHVNGPAAEPIRAEIVRLLESLGAKLGMHANTPEAPRESPRPTHPPTSSGDGNQPSLRPSAADAGPTVPAPPANSAAGEPSRDPPPPTPPTAAAPPPSNDLPANAAGFSETKELVLSMNSNKFMLDLDTGDTMDPPATIRPEQAKMDLSTTQVQPYHYPTGLVGHSLQGKEVKPSDWSASVADVRRGLAGNIYALKGMDVGPEKNPTYFFKTRDGALGILQLLGVTDEPKGVRLRYKTVLTGSNAKKSAPQNESLAKIQGDWIVEKMTFGQEDALGMAADRRYQITVKDDSLTLLYRLVNKPETLSTTPMRVDRIDNTSAVIVPLGIASYEPRMPALLECDGRTLRLCWRLSSGKGGVFVPPPALAPAENVVYYECRRRTEDDFNLAPGSAEQPPQPIAPSTAPKPAQDTPQSLDKASAIELRLAYSQPGDGLVEMAIAGGDEKVYVAQDTIATDAGIANAEVIDDSAGQAVIQFTFKDEAAKHLRAATGQHRDKPLAILVNGNMLAAPIVRDAIGGKALISGKFSREEAQRIVTLVNSLPQEARRFHTREGVHRIAASADGKLIAVANGNPTFILQADGTSRVKDNWKPQVEILDANTGASVRVISPVFSPTVSAVLEATRRVNHIEVTALAFSPVEEVIAVGTSIGQVLLFNSRTGMLLNSLDDKEPRLADKETPEIWKPLQRAMGSVASISFSPDGSLLAVCGNSFEDFSDVFDGIEQLRRGSTAPGRLKVFAVKTGALKHDLAGHSHAFDVAFSTDGSLLASAGRWDGGNDPGNGVLVWNPQSGEKMRTILIEANGGTHRVAFSPNQKLIATGSELYDKEKDTSSTSIAVMYPLSGSREWQRVVPGWSKLEFVPDGTALAVLSGGQSIQYLDVRTGQTKQVPTAPFAPPGARFNDFAVAHKGRKLAVGGIDANRRGLVFVWPTGEGSAASP